MTDNGAKQPAALSGDRPKWLLHPYIILGITIFLPGVGQVLNNMAFRGISLLFFMIILGWASYNTTTPDHSTLGRLAGGLIIYAIALLDAYRWARYRWEYFKKR